METVGLTITPKGKLLGFITKRSEPFPVNWTGLLDPIQKNACILMNLEGDNDFLLSVQLKNVNFEEGDYIFPEISMSKSKMDKLKSLEFVDISFHCQDPETELGKFDVDIASLSTIEDVEQIEPQEIPQNPLVDVPEVIHVANTQMTQPFTAENREHSISESSSLGLHDDIQYTMHFLSMLDLAENITPEVLSENSSDEEDTDASLVYCPVHLQPAYI